MSLQSFQANPARLFQRFPPIHALVLLVGFTTILAGSLRLMLDGGDQSFLPYLILLLMVLVAIAAHAIYRQHNSGELALYDDYLVINKGGRELQLRLDELVDLRLSRQSVRSLARTKGESVTLIVGDHRETVRLTHFSEEGTNQLASLGQALIEKATPLWLNRLKCGEIMKGVGWSVDQYGITVGHGHQSIPWASIMDPTQDNNDIYIWRVQQPKAVLSLASGTRNVPMLLACGHRLATGSKVMDHPWGKHRFQKRRGRILHLITSVLLANIMVLPLLFLRFEKLGEKAAKGDFHLWAIGLMALIGTVWATWAISRTFHFYEHVVEVTSILGRRHFVYAELDRFKIESTEMLNKSKRVTILMNQHHRMRLKMVIYSDKAPDWTDTLETLIHNDKAERSSVFSNRS